MNFINPAHGDLKTLAEKFKNNYANAVPYPSISFKDFFDKDMLDGVLSEFEDLDKGATLKYETPNEIKLASKGESRFGDKTKQFVHYLNSEPFLEFLQVLTGIEETLVPDPFFEGGGFHQTKAGGFLKIHADFNKHKLTKLDRRLNILIYLNKDWKEEYGGYFEMWDKDRSRKSIALYYYSNGRPSSEVNQGLEDHTTLFVARKGDTIDEQMVKFNKKQGVKELVKDLTPPMVFRLAKKVMGSEN